MTEPPTLKSQAAAVARAAVNLRGHVNNLRDLVTRPNWDRQKRDPLELDVAAQWLPALEAAAITMERLAAQESS